MATYKKKRYSGRLTGTQRKVAAKVSPGFADT
jgi:hypothetical protein